MNQPQLPEAPKQSPVASAPLRLMPVSASAAVQSRILPLLHAAGLDGADNGAGLPGAPMLLAQKDIGGLEQLSDRVSASPDVHLLVFVPIPILDIARRMADGSAPRQALSQWLDEAGKILTLVRSFRRRSSVFFFEAALSNPGGFVGALGQRLHLELDFREPEDLTPELPKAVLRMLAENALWQSPEARNLAAELEATALPIPTKQDFLLPAADQVFSEYRKTVDTPAQMARELREENGLLLEQLQRVQQKMEAFTAEKKSIEDRLSSAEQYKADLENTRRQLEALQNQEHLSPKLKDLEEENELLLHQLHHVQEELETYYLKSQDTDRQLADCRNELAHVHDELNIANSAVNALRNSLSWKITGPMRAILGVFSGGKKHGPKT